MKRRVFIKLSAYGAAAAGVPLLSSCNDRPVNAALAQPEFLSRIFDAETMLETGRAYLKQTPDENDKNKLKDLLTSNTTVTTSSDTKSVHAYLDKKVQQDFVEGKIAVVEGWILSRTEARQCALYSLMQKK